MKRFFGTAVVGLIGAILGSFSMMLFASTHFTNVAGPGNTPPVVSAAPLINGGRAIRSASSTRSSASNRRSSPCWSP